jgi:hypothetical protein
MDIHILSPRGTDPTGTVEQSRRFNDMAQGWGEQCSLLAITNDANNLPLTGYRSTLLSASTQSSSEMSRCSSEF